MPITNFLSIDVEDYFQVSAFEAISPPASWDKRELRVEKSTDKVLAILSETGTKATFFILGWIAERCPELVRTISDQGHEIASHGYWHQRVSNQNRAEFREDIRKSKKLLEDISGQEISGYRAPSYSISRATIWAFDELHEAGYRYDSSIFPMQHDFYGMPDWPRFSGYAVKQAERWVAKQTCNSAEKAIREIPITTLRLGQKNLPIAGGGYFRLLPYAVTRWGLNRINQQEQQPFVFYLHPWEFDPQQPRMDGCSAKSRFRHYLNLGKTSSRFRQLLENFEFTSLNKAL